MVTEQPNQSDFNACLAAAVGHQIGTPQAVSVPAACPFSAFVCQVRLPPGCRPPAGSMGFRIGGGVALERECARRLCLIEGIERYSLQYQAGDPERFRSREIAGAADAEFSAADVLLGHPGRDAVFGLTDSRGCAAGSCIVDAAIRALLELVEFGAIDRWRGGNEDFRTATPADPQIMAIGNWLKTRNKVQKFAQWRHPGGATVAIALTCNRDGRHPALGSAARLDPQAAFAHASLESAFASLNLAEIDRRNRDDADLSPADRETLAVYRGEIALPPLALPRKSETGIARGTEDRALDGDGMKMLERLIANLPEPLAILDLSRSETGIAVARAILLPAANPRLERHTETF